MTDDTFVTYFQFVYHHIHPHIACITNAPIPTGTHTCFALPRPIRHETEFLNLDIDSVTPFLLCDLFRFRVIPTHLQNKITAGHDFVSDALIRAGKW